MSWEEREAKSSCWAAAAAAVWCCGVVRRCVVLRDGCSEPHKEGWKRCDAVTHPIKGIVRSPGWQQAACWEGHAK